MGKLLRSSQFRLSLVYLGIFGGSVLILLGFLYWATVGYMARQTEATIDAEVQGLAEQYRQRGLTGLSSLLRERSRHNASSVYLLTDAQLRPMVGNLGRWPESVSKTDDWLTFRLPISADTGPELHTARARQFRLRGGLRLLVGRDVQELVAMEQLLQRALMWGLVVTSLLGLGGAITMSRSMVHRLDSINQTTGRIMAGDLSRRVPSAGSGDDFDELADNLNAMLDRIQRLMEDVRRVSDNVAHDLRTPLTRIKNQLDEIAVSPTLGDTQRAAVRTVIAEADALLSTFNALLRIARVEAGERRQRFESVDLAEIAQDVLEFYDPLADAKGLQLTSGLIYGLQVSGDRDLLFQALANLVDNAIKYTPAPGKVTIRSRVKLGRAIVEVSDSGPGIPVRYRDKVLQRFTRLDDSRSTPGNGLGLSLVAAVAQLHGAKLVLGGTDGLLVQLDFEREHVPPPAISGSKVTRGSPALLPTPSGRVLPG